MRLLALDKPKIVSRRLRMSALLFAKPPSGVGSVYSNKRMTFVHPLVHSIKQRLCYSIT